MLFLLIVLNGGECDTATFHRILLYSKVRRGR